MKLSEIKREIHAQLDATNDDTLLEVVHDILRNGLPIADEILQSKSLKASVDRGMEEVKRGRLLDDEQANKEIEEWLKR